MPVISLVDKVVKTMDWRRPFASAYFRSAGGYLAIKLAVFSLAGLATQYLLTNYLAVKDYGLIIWAGTIIALLGPFGLPGISTSIVGAVAKGFDGNFRRGTWLEMAGGTLGGLALLGIAGYYWFWTHEPEKALIFVVAGVMGPGLWLDTQQCYWNGKKNFKALFWWAVPVRLLQLLITASVLCFSANPVLVFGAQTLIQVAANMGASLWLIKLGNINEASSREFQDFGWFSTKLYLGGVFVSQLDKLIIGYFWGLNSLAVFAVGELLYTYFYKTPASFLAQIFLPRLAEMGVGDAARWIRGRQIYIITFLAAAVVSVALLVPSIYEIMFSAKYQKSVLYAYLFLGCILLGAPTLLGGTLLKAHALKRETEAAWRIMAITPIILTPLCGWMFGIVGIVLARGMTNLLLSLYYSRMLRRLSA